MRDQADARTSRPTARHLPPDPARRRSVVSRFNFDAAIQMHRALAILVVAERLQRQRLQKGLLFGEHRRHLPLGAAVDALVGPALFPVVQIRLRLFQALELLALQWRLLRMVDATFDFSFSIWIAHFARQRRHAVVRQNVAIQGIQARIVEVLETTRPREGCPEPRPAANRQAGEMPSRASSAHTRALDRKTSSRTHLRLQPSVSTNSRVRRYLPLSGSRTIGPVP